MKSINLNVFQDLRSAVIDEIRQVLLSTPNLSIDFENSKQFAHIGKDGTVFNFDWVTAADDGTATYYQLMSIVLDPQEKWDINVFYNTYDFCNKEGGAFKEDITMFSADELYSMMIAIKDLQDMHLQSNGGEREEMQNKQV